MHLILNLHAYIYNRPCCYDTNPNRYIVMINVLRATVNSFLACVPIIILCRGILKTV